MSPKKRIQFALFVAIFSCVAKHAKTFTQPHCILRSFRTRASRPHLLVTGLNMGQGELKQPSPLIVALTREDGKNDKLRDALLSNQRIRQLSKSSGVSFQINEIPCIEHALGADRDKLSSTLAMEDFDYIVITSPEAAKILAHAWIEAGQPKLGMVAAVGKATEEKLNEFGIDVSFVPSKATATTLAKELPLSDDGNTSTALYPASAKANDTLQKGLEKRGFSVVRLNTYDTVPASWNDNQISLAKSASVVCFASPSAVKAWLKNTDRFETPRALASCIGETSATACRTNNWRREHIFYPEKPGVAGWAVAVADALEYLTKEISVNYSF